MYAQLTITENRGKSPAALSMINLILPLLLFVGLTSCYSQSQSPDSLLNKIYHLQSKGDNFCHDGLFPSKRYGVREKDKKNDNNSFFTGLIAYTLQSVYPSFSTESRKRVDSVIARARTNYPRYKNRNGDITYNFWQTHPDQPFPNSKYSKRERFRLPDDLDVSAIICLTTKGSWKEDSLLKNKMIAYTNLYKKKIHSTYKRYRNFKAYNTWFGKDMDLEFDICVMSNVLLFACQKGLAINQYDRETVDVVNQIVKNGDHIKHPYIISPSYQSSAVILYHLARLLSVAPPSQF